MIRASLSKEILQLLHCLLSNPIVLANSVVLQLPRALIYPSLVYREICCIKLICHIAMRAAFLKNLPSIWSQFHLVKALTYVPNIWHTLSIVVFLAFLTAIAAIHTSRRLCHSIKPVDVSFLCRLAIKHFPDWLVLYLVFFYRSGKLGIDIFKAEAWNHSTIKLHSRLSKKRLWCGQVLTRWR